MDELCQSLFNVDLDMEEKYFEQVSYDSNDPDFNWKPSHTDETSSTCDSESTDKALQSSNNNKATPQRKRSRNHSPVLFNQDDDDDEISKIDEHGSSISENNKLKQSRWDHSKGDSDIRASSDSEDNGQQILTTHRRSVFNKSGNSSACTPERFNAYPNNWESVKTSPMHIVPTGARGYNSVSPNLYRQRDLYNERNVSVCSPSSSDDGTYPSHNSSFTIGGQGSNKHNFKTPKKSRRSLSTYSKRPTILTNGILPQYRNYQLLGDSQLLRFSEKILNCQSVTTRTESGGTIRRLGYCVSGQKIGDLENRIVNKECSLATNFIMLIGTNDLVYHTDLAAMCESYDIILNELKKTAEHIILLTVPPVARYGDDEAHWRCLQQFNKFITNCADGEKIVVVDLASIFISYANTVSLKYFEEVITNKHGSKPDLVHLNLDGFKLLQAVLDIQYFGRQGAYSNH